MAKISHVLSESLEPVFSHLCGIELGGCLGDALRQQHPVRGGAQQHPARRIQGKVTHVPKKMFQGFS